MSTRAIDAAKHVPELDGLRGIAILAVMAFHVQPPKPFYGHFDFLWSVFRLGHSGVDLFFVLSGFLITTILLNTRESPQYFRSFYGRRAVRIFPLYFAALIAFYHIHLPLMHHAGMWLEITHSEEVWYWTYLANWRQAAERVVLPLDHFWSLCIEEQFYFFWPAAVYLCSAQVLPKICIAMICSSFGMGIVLDLSGASNGFVYRVTITRIGTLLCGALLAWIAQHPEWLNKFSGKLKTAFVIAVGAFVFVEVEYWNNGGPLTNSSRFLLVAIACSALVLTCVERAGSTDIICRVARNPALRSFGKYSYCLYVVHILVKSMVSTYVTDRAPNSTAMAFGATLLSFVATYAVGVASWNLLEKHFLRLKKHFPYEMPQSESTGPRSRALQQQAVPATAGE